MMTQVSTPSIQVARHTSKGVPCLQQFVHVNLVVSSRGVARSLLPHQQPLMFPMMSAMMIIPVMSDMETLLWSINCQAWGINKTILLGSKLTLRNMRDSFKGASSYKLTCKKKARWCKSGCEIKMSILQGIVSWSASQSRTQMLDEGGTNKKKYAWNWS